MPDFSDAFAWDQPFQEAVEFFLSKGIMTRGEFDKLAAAEKVKAFTAAYVYEADELQRVFDGVQAALEKGTTLRDFVKTTEDMLTRPWHRETVFRTNVLSSYGAGHWEQAQANRALRPYARYSAVMDGRTRPRHAALHGLIYSLDHEFWKMYWPPWDYNCRCAAFTLSQNEIDSQGLKVSQGEPPAAGPRNNFVSPARGGTWAPDLGKYAPEIASQIPALVRPKGPYIAAKTIKEAETWASTHIAKRVNYKGISLDVANLINKTIRNNIGGSNLKFDYIDSSERMRKLWGMKGKGDKALMACYKKGEETAFVFTKNIKDMEIFETNLRKINNAGLMKNVSKEEAITHEIGHFIDFKNEQGWDRPCDKLMSLFHRSVDDQLLDIPPQRRKIQDKVGDYIFSNAREFFAECFRLWKFNKLPNELNFVKPFMERIKTK